ncbi:MAG: sugar transferase [Phycisphaerales bacterium]|nr:MAG: sugar transferase [Phycisphaerales bacterium]
MIQQLQTARSSITRRAPTDPPRVWGLTAGQLHDAYWRARGVQCIRRGQRQTWQRGAELYLLLEPDQLVAFDLGRICGRLTWHNAIVTRLRLIDGHEARYSEHVVTDEEGFVLRIERRYRRSSQRSSRVVLTPHRRVARIWMAAHSRREGWDRVRRSVPWPRVDHGKCAGATFTLGDADHERRLISTLVECWPDPGRSISGIEESDPGVWRPADGAARYDEVRIGPLWLGFDGHESHRPCIVGPDWTGDSPAHLSRGEPAPAVLDIIDVELTDRPHDHHSRAPGATYAFCKRVFDIIVSAVALTCLSPIMAIIAVLVLLEDGMPIFFGHRRQGRSGRPFRCWKFRTMHRDSERLVRRLEDYNLCDGPQVFIPDDPRVTRIGRVLRDTHLDELPQFLNVIFGQMSIVGPRPSPDDENQFCPAWRDVRLSVRPGITGLWQLHRTREPGEDFQEWIKYDIEYVRQASFLLDLNIIAGTVRAMLLGRSDRASD